MQESEHGYPDREGLARDEQNPPEARDPVSRPSERDSGGSGISEASDAMGIDAEVVLRLGKMLMGAGTSGYRVVRGMKRAARALGFEQIDADIGVNTITCTFHRGNRLCTVVARQEFIGVDSSRIEALHNLTHVLGPGLTAEELSAQLDDVEALVRKRWSQPVRCLAAGCACAGFAVLNGLSPKEVAAVAVAAFLGQLVRGFMDSRQVSPLGGVAAAGVAACLAYWVIGQVLGMLQLVNPGIYPGFVASVLFLIPGFPLFSSLLDLARFDITAGVARLVHALAVIATATFAVAIVAWATGMNPAVVGSFASPSLLAVGVASFVGVAGFAFIFNSSRRMVLVAACVGAVANVGRLVVLDAGATPYIAAFCGGIIAGVLGWMAVTVAQIPRITTTVPASVIMIPGPAMFRAVYGTNAGDMDLVVNNFATAGMTVIAIAAGLVLARMVTDRDWTFGRPIDFGKFDVPRAHGPHSGGRG